MKKLFSLMLLSGSFISSCQSAESPSISTNEMTPPTPIAQLSSPSETTPSITTEPTPETRRSCQISAYLIDKDPKGLNVRSGAGQNYRVIDQLPTTPVAVFVDINASQGNWVQLTRAESPEKVEFSGTGWVYASLLGTTTRGYGTEGVIVYSRATPDSQVVGRIPPEKQVKLLGCDRSWVLVEYQQIKGWIAPDSQCPNSLTTCP